MNKILVCGFLSKLAMRSGVSLGLESNPSGYGVHDKRTGEDNSYLAYAHNTLPAAMLSGIMSGGHNAVYGMSLASGLASIPRHGTRKYEEGFRRLANKEEVKKKYKDILSKLREDSAGDTAKALKREVLGTRHTFGRYINWGKATSRFTRGAATGAVAGAAVKALYNAAEYHKDKALAGKPLPV